MILEAKDLVVRFGVTRVLNGLNLQVRKSEAVGIIGPNGCGKTTFFNAVCGFVPLTRGELNFNGQPIASVPAHQRARSGIARVFQNTGVFKEMTVAENMLVALETRDKGIDPIFSWGRKYRQYLKEASQMLEEVKLDLRLHEKAANLSGGQLRLLEITRAVAFGADLFLLDEPTAGVSPKMKDEVVNAVKRLKESGKTILTIEHDINLIDRFCDKVIVFDAGQVVLEGTPMEVRNNPLLQEVYFGVSA